MVLYLLSLLGFFLFLKHLFKSSSLDGVSLMYQRVQRVESSSPRPVLVLGPLVEVCKDVLVKESPAKFSRCPPGELPRRPESGLQTHRHVNDS